MRDRCHHCTSARLTYCNRSVLTVFASSLYARTTAGRKWPTAGEGFGVDRAEVGEVERRLDRTGDVVPVPASAGLAHGRHREQPRLRGTRVRLVVVERDAGGVVAVRDALDELVDEEPGEPGRVDAVGRVEHQGDTSSGRFRARVRAAGRASAPRDRGGAARHVARATRCPRPRRGATRARTVARRHARARPAASNAAARRDRSGRAASDARARRRARRRSAPRSGATPGTTRRTPRGTPPTMSPPASASFAALRRSVSSTRAASARASRSAPMTADVPFTPKRAAPSTRRGVARRQERSRRGRRRAR